MDKLSAIYYIFYTLLRHIKTKKIIKKKKNNEKKATLSYTTNVINKKSLNTIKETIKQKKVSESDDPADISYSKYKEMLINCVKDIIEILWHNIEDLIPKKKISDHYLSIVNT